MDLFRNFIRFVAGVIMLVAQPHGAGFTRDASLCVDEKCTRVCRDSHLDVPTFIRQGRVLSIN